MPAAILFVDRWEEIQNKGFVFAELVLFAVAFIRGIHSAIVKIGRVTVPPVPYNALRLLLAMAWAGVIFWGLYFARSRQAAQAAQED